jgi:hypothetical protein
MLFLATKDVGATVVSCSTFANAQAAAAKVFNCTPAELDVCKPIVLGQIIALDDGGGNEEEPDTVQKAAERGFNS